ncbi:MAG: CD225/dispanin family protein [Muribaculaceae bacterium]|nr:CD225/dispanin family protein [Muribaculaceae bacterium]
MNAYYYINQANQQVGPIDGSQLLQAGVGRDTMVWCAGMPTWTRAADVPELAPLFAASQPVYGPKYGDPNGGAYGQPYSPGAQPPMVQPQSYLWLAILSTVLCCMPLGIVSIIYASKVNSCWTQGRYQEAYDNSKNARLWALIGAGVGLVVSIIYFFVVIAELLN